MSTESTTSSIYLPDEIIDKEYLQTVRMKLIKNMMKDESNLPEDAKTLEAMNALISSGEKAINDSVANRLKYQDNQNKDALNELVAATLLQLGVNNNTNSNSVNNNEKELPSDLIPVDVVPGELSTDTTELEIEDFIEG